ncbi:MAG: PIG-L family deacetylase [Kiritimatiellae bacterium]|nr:PIG-L family deacetylase [Kiritimatiellia bacterium]
MNTSRLFHRAGLVRKMVALAFLLAVAWTAAARGQDAEPLLLGDDGDRLLVLAPHPDDEALGAGGLIQEAVELGVPVKVCFLTMGDNNELAFMFVRKHPVVMPGAVRRMGETRCAEAREAARRMGLDPDRDLVFLGYPDFGTLRIWNDHWRDVTPLRSMLTRATSVPYVQARTPGAAYAGEDLLEDLTEVIREFRPTHVAMPTAADQNPDHRALYLFARVALWTLAAEEGLEPLRLGYPVHYPRWPSPRGLHPALDAAPPPYLLRSGEIAWRVHSLAPWQVTNKLEAVRAHRSQCTYSEGYLSSFVRASEWFGDFPDIVLPGGVGQEKVEDGDTGAFSQDDAFIGELAKADPAWLKLAEQQDAEEAEVAEADADFLDRNISSDGRNLTVVCRFSRPLSPRASVTLRFHGWRADTPFGEMPKLAVCTGPRKVKSVTDLNRRLDTSAVALPGGLARGELGVTVPLELLGNPEKLLLSARIAFGEMPLDWASWRAVDLGTGAPAVPAASAPKAPAVPKPAQPAGPADPYAEVTARRGTAATASGAGSLRLAPRVSTAPGRPSASKASPTPEPPTAPAEPGKKPAKPEPPSRRTRAASAGSADEPVVW